MKKLLCLLSLFVFTTASVAQTTDNQQRIRMSLTPRGLFLDSLSNSYAVIPFEGKTQSELYEMVLKNLNKLYDSPKEVLSLFENEMITIYASTTKLAYIFPLINITNEPLEGLTYYTIKVYFKDNKIRMDYPKITEVTFGNAKMNMPESYSYYMGKHFDKKGKVKEKRVALVNAIEKYANWLCNSIIYGSEQTQNEGTKDNDW